MSVRLRRLYADYQLLSNLFTDSSYINIQEYNGNPPERYIVEYRVKGIVEDEGKIREKDMHLVEMILPKGYPREAPFCRMLSPLYHPNISPQQICIGDHWAAGESLAHLLIRIAEMICYQSYNLKSPLNGEAAMWTDLNITSVPLDKTDFYSAYADREAEILADPTIPPKVIEQPAPPVAAPKFHTEYGQMPGFVREIPEDERFVCVSRPGDISPHALLQKNFAPVPEADARGFNTCENCGKAVPPGKIYCNDCYSQNQAPVASGMANSSSVPEMGLFAPKRKTHCENCNASFQNHKTIICSFGHSVCPDCAFTCSRCGRYFCALCGKDKYRFADNGVICFRCQGVNR
ncbi:MAG: hypothetical protein LWY06_03970 [Firmicutes bacterium]|nr:hypothetical protein [Bacillota bacterium]